MTVNKLIERLQEIQSEGYGECEVFAEGVEAEKVALQNCPDNHHIVRIFKPWDVEFVVRPMYEEASK